MPDLPTDSVADAARPARPENSPPEKPAREKHWRADLAMIGFGALAGLALPPLYLVPLLLVCAPALVRAIGRARTPWVAARRGFWFGVGLHVVGLYWITEAIMFEAARLWWSVPLAVPALAAVLAVFIAAPCALAWAARPGWPRVLALAGAWTLGDVARAFIATGFPWNPWASVWEFPGLPGDVLIQPAAWIGVYGLTWLTVLLACTPTLPRRFWAAGAGVLVVWAGLGAWRLSWPAPPGPHGADGQPIHVLLLQGNIAQGQKWNRSLMIDIFNAYLDLTRKSVAAAGTGAKVVVWPETASPFTLTDDASARDAIATAVGPDAVTLAGTVRFDADQRPRNSLAVISAAGALLGQYDKWHLVPFGEFQPSWFPLPFQVVPGGGFAAGPGPRTLSLPDGIPPTGPMICYEAIYSGEMVDEADRPSWLVNVTNDAWFGNSSGPRQHLAAVRLRAVEEGLPLLRAANTGITVAFDGRGHELARLPRVEPGFLLIDLPGAFNFTVYARFGLAIPVTLATVSLVIAFGSRRLARSA
jgi:apolipoprotein N-acyltransferase